MGIEPVSVKPVRDQVRRHHAIIPVSSPLRPAIFLDRDGVLNRTTVRGDTPYPPQSLADVEILTGVADALDRLRRRGLPLIVVTNQPDVARGSQTRDRVEQINQFLAQQLRLDAGLA